MVFTESAKVDNIKKFFMDFKDESGKYKYIDEIDALTGSNLMIKLYDFFDYERKSEIDFPSWDYHKQTVFLTALNYGHLYTPKFL